MTQLNDGHFGRLDGRHVGKEAIAPQSLGQFPDDGRHIQILSIHKLQKNKQTKSKNYPPHSTRTTPRKRKETAKE